MQDRLPERIDSKFRFVLLSAHRAEQIMRGARPRIEGTGKKVARGAMEEILQGVVEWDYGPPPQPEPQAETVEGGEEEAEPESVN